MKVNISWAFAGNSIYAGCQWIVFVLLVRWLELSDVGLFAYWVAVTGPIFVLSNLRLRNLLATSVPSPHGFVDYLGARLLTTAAALAASLAAGAVGAADGRSLSVLALVLCARASDAFADICHGLFQRERDLRSAAIGLAINGLLSVAFVSAALWIWPTLPAAAGAYAAASVAALTTWDVRRIRQHAGWSRPGSSIAVLRAATGLVWRAAPLGLSSAIGSVQTNLPRYAVATFLGPAALAVFSALAYLPTAVNLVANAVAQAALPALAGDLRVSRDAYGRRLRQLVQSGVLLGALTVLTTAVAGSTVVGAIYGPAFSEHGEVLLGLMTAAAISYAFVFLGTASTARMRFGAQLIISVAGTSTVAALVVPLVSRYGLPGAAYALCAGALVEGCAYAVLTVRDFRDDARLRGIGGGAIAGACSR